MGRRGETLALRWGGVDFDAGTVSIEGTGSIGDDGAQVRSRTKTNKSGKVALSSITLDHLLAHKARVENLLEEAAGEPLEVDPERARVQRRGREPARHPRRGPVATGLHEPAVSPAP